jgi:excisionase family DNA binding protein
VFTIEYYTVKEIAELLSVNEETVRRWIREDKLKAERGSGRQGSKVTSDALKEFLEDNKGLVTSMAASTLGLSSAAMIGTGALMAGLAVPVSGAVLAGLSWLSILKSKNKDKKEIRVELMEKELELENLAMQLKTEIAAKQNELEMIENQISKLKDILRENK